MHEKKLIVSDEPIGNVFRTSDLDEARSVVAASYGPHLLQVASRGLFESRMQSAELGPVNIFLHTYGADVKLVSPPLDKWYVVCLPVSGHISARCGTDWSVIGGNRGVVLRPDAPIEFDHWNHDSTMLALQISRAELEDELARTLNRAVRGPISFQFAVDAGQHTEPLLRSLDYLLQELRSPAGMLDHPATRAQFCRLVMAGLLAGQPHDYSAQLADDNELTPRAMREAIALINERYAEPLTVSDIAMAAGCGVRSLEESFQRHIGESPMTYLRQVRLNHARVALRAADHLETTVASIAHQCGFTHVPRFAAYYRQQYGVPPSAELRRCGKRLES